ncbi:hypothetical protein VTJ83DRAFT_5188 [Remersonia thermophila]|uniref:Uncharacterized protein n=1 Tax=Remersonia thermophila TaxID=72144 RepID=A0ABR4DC45_9PEZI
MDAAAIDQVPADRYEAAEPWAILDLPHRGSATSPAADQDVAKEECSDQKSDRCAGQDAVPGADASPPQPVRPHAETTSDPTIPQFPRAENSAPAGEDEDAGAGNPAVELDAETMVGSDLSRLSLHDEELFTLRPINRSSTATTTTTTTTTLWSEGSGAHERNADAETEGLVSPTRRRFSFRQQQDPLRTCDKVEKAVIVVGTADRPEM